MKEEIKVDAKRLIAEVYKRSALWNQKDVLYHNRDVTNRIWMELSTLLSLPKAVLKAKWKGLRDTFRAEIKKERVHHKNEFPRCKSVWIHYKRLQFLKEQMLPHPPIWERENSNNNCSTKDESEKTSSTKNVHLARPSKSRVGAKIISGRKSAQANTEIFMTGNNNLHLSDGNDSATENIKDENKKLTKSKTPLLNDIQQTSEVLATNTSIAIDTTHTLINNTNDILPNEHVGITVKHEPVEEITENIEYHDVISSGSSRENEMMTQTISPQVLMSNTISDICGTQLTVDPLEGNRLDDNYYFLMSLLPHIKTLPAERRMLLRMQMQELVYKEVYKKNNGVHSS